VPSPWRAALSSCGRPCDSFKGASPNSVRVTVGDSTESENVQYVCDTTRGFQNTCCKPKIRTLLFSPYSAPGSTHLQSRIEEVPSPGVFSFGECTWVG
jgi:hypothetical protein